MNTYNPVLYIYFLFKYLKYSKKIKSYSIEFQHLNLNNNSIMDKLTLFLKFNTFTKKAQIVF